jgi:hypothetical protein
LLKYVFSCANTLVFKTTMRVKQSRFSRFISLFRAIT